MNRLSVTSPWLSPILVGAPDAFAPDAAPPIVIGQNQHHELNVMAMVSPGHDANASDALFHELDRAWVISDELVPDEVVRMGSGVSYLMRRGGLYHGTVMSPAEAAGQPGRISVLSPVGTALIGLSPGQAISWRNADGRSDALMVVSVRPSADLAPPLRPSAARP